MSHTYTPQTDQKPPDNDFPSSLDFSTRLEATQSIVVPKKQWSCLRYQLILSQVILWNGTSTVTHEARDSTCDYFCNEDYYHDEIAELTRKFGKITAYWRCLPVSISIFEPNNFVCFTSFLRRLLQTFPLHNLEADLKSSAVLRMARSKLNATTTIRCKRHSKNLTFLQLNYTHYADWINSYAEMCEKNSNQLNQRNRLKNSKIFRGESVFEKWFSNSANEHKEQQQQTAE